MIRKWLPTIMFIHSVGILAVTNALVVSTLYWNQVTLSFISAELDDGLLPISAIPFATFVGYATGVATIAFTPHAGTRISVRSQLIVLGMALISCSIAPSSPLLVLASIFVGIGASVAQRILSAAVQLGGVTSAGATLGVVIATALFGLIAVRLGGEMLATLMGWRVVFLSVGFLICICSLYGFDKSLTPQSPMRLPSTIKWSPLLWQAGLQQASFFAAYNSGWVLLLLESQAEQRRLAIVGAGMTGLFTAMLSGRLSDQARHDQVIRIAATSMVVAATLVLPAAYSAVQGAEKGVLLVIGMMMLDAGLQAALVANQARVQALLPSARTRLAASMTIFGALGGAIGASTAHWLWDGFNWQSAIYVPATASIVGLASTCFPWPGRTLVYFFRERSPKGSPNRMLRPRYGQEITRASRTGPYQRSL